MAAKKHREYLEEWSKPEAQVALAKWPDEPSAHGDAYWLMMASGGDLCALIPQALEGNEGALPSYMTPVVNGGGRWENDMATKISLQTVADGLARGNAQDRMQQSIAAGMSEIKAAGILARYMRHLHSSPEARVRASAAVLHTVIAAMRKAERSPGDRALICYADEPDANVRYLGMRDCVYDLEAGERLGREEARVTLTTKAVAARLKDLPDLSVPGALHPDVEVMMYRRDMADDLMLYLRRSLAWSLKGLPAQRYNLLIDADQGRGPAKGNAGKSTLLQAVQYALGDYGSTLDLTAMQIGKPGTATPELAPLAVARYAWTDEANALRMNSERWKRMTGSTLIRYRLLYKHFVERVVTASLFGASNAPLKLDLTGDAEKRRYRPIPVPEIPPEERLPHLKHAFEPHARGRGKRCTHLVALLLGELSGMTGEPEPTQAVLDLADEHQKANDGTLGEWARAELEVTESENDRVSTKAAWLAYCAMTPEREKWATQRLLTGVVTRVTGQPTKTQHIDGKTQNGWRCLKLSETAVMAAGAARQSAY